MKGIMRRTLDATRGLAPSFRSTGGKIRPRAAGLRPFSSVEFDAGNRLSVPSTPMGVFANAQQPCISYWVGPNLYVQVTNRCNTTPLHATRGPGFAMDTDFRPLLEGYEPAASEVTRNVTGALQASNSSMARNRQEVVFAGWGEPTLRWSTVREVAARIRTCNRNVRLRLSTNGLGSLVMQRNIVPEVLSYFDSVSVALNTASSHQYDDIMKPKLGVVGEMEVKAMEVKSTVPFRLPETYAHAIVREFIQECVDAGVPTEVTAVERPDVNLYLVKRLATAMGASFRSRPYFV